MTEALASRVAGWKLSGIVGVLLLPMLVLSYLMVNSLREDIRVSEREMKGVALNRLVMPVAVGAALRYIDPSDVDRLRERGPALAAQLGVKRPLAGALADLVTYGFDQRLSVNSLRQLQVAAAASSLIIHDPDSETYHLGAVMSQQAPSLLGDFARIWTFKSSSLKDGQVSREESTAILLATGSWEESQRRLAASLAAAQTTSGSDAAYGDAMAAIKVMSGRPGRVATVITKSAPADLTRALAQIDDFGVKSPEVVAEISQVWSFASSRFEMLLRERLTAMQIRLYGFLSIAAAACIIGVGAATLMFKSTLKQLDTVKLSRDQADAARSEAEQAAQDVQRINEEVIRLNAGLARNIDMLREAQDESVRKGKMAQLGQLTATVAHELRNPLGAVRTSAFLLERKVKGKGLGVEQQLDRINNGVTRCDNIISQLLDFARTKTIQPETIVLDDWLAKIIEEEAQNLPAAVDIECDLSLGTTAVPFDPLRMRRALINLVSNAAEAMVGKGDTSVRPGVKSPLIVIRTARTARGVEISVCDNGPGIAPENLQKIFEPLFTTKNFGTGLGLPAVEKIMEQHSGGLEVVSKPGQGAAFIAWWPVTASSDAAA